MRDLGQLREAAALVLANRAAVPKALDPDRFRHCLSAC